MKKKMKLNLEDLNVQTFVTSLEDEEKKAAKGGYFTQYILQCISSDIGPCCNLTILFPPCLSDVCTATCPPETVLGPGCPKEPMEPVIS